MRIVSQQLTDQFGIGVSGLCMVHCVFTPLALVSTPLLPLFEMVESWLHPLFILLIIPTSIIAFLTSAGKPNALEVRMLLSFGLIIVILSYVGGHMEVLWSLESSLTIAGSVLLVSGHWQNTRTFTETEYTPQTL